jgi:hypothetical protein
MSARDLIDLAARHPLILGALAVVPLLLVPIVASAHGRGRGGESPWRYLYALLVYAVSVPGIGAAVLTAYTLFFTGENLLDKNLLVYVLPVVSMGCTLALIGKNVSFDQVPGFDRLSGLLVLIGVTFALLLAIRKTFVGILFVGSIAKLLVLGVGIFALLRWGTYALFRRSDEPRTRPPVF